MNHWPPVTIYVNLLNLIRIDIIIYLKIKMQSLIAALASRFVQMGLDVTESAI